MLKRLWTYLKENYKIPPKIKKFNNYIWGLINTTILIAVLVFFLIILKKLLFCLL